MEKKQTSIRLSLEAEKQLKTLIELTGRIQTEVIAIALDRYYRDVAIEMLESIKRKEKGTEKQ